VLLAALAITVHVLVNQKYIGHIVVLVACVLAILAKPVGRFPYLANLQQRTALERTPIMNGFGPFLAPYLWFKLYWAMWALLLAVIAVIFWIRGARVRATTPPQRRACASPRPDAANGRHGRRADAMVAVGSSHNTNILNANPRASRSGGHRPSTNGDSGGFAACSNRSSPRRICAWRIPPQAGR
jgi:hypothetical protein